MFVSMRWHHNPLSIFLLPLIALLGIIGYEAWRGDWRVSPPYRVRADGLYPQAQDFSFQRDETGLRSNPDAGKVSILSLGGALVEQPFLPDHLTWQAQLADRLHQAGIKGLVGNGGRQDWTIHDLLTAVDRWPDKAPDLHPRFVLIMLDDIKIASHPPERRTPKARSALYRDLFGPYMDYLTTATDWHTARWTETPTQAKADPLPPETVDLLRHLAQGIHQWGAVPIFVTALRGDAQTRGGKTMGLVTDSGPNGVDQARRLNRLNHTVLKLCRDDGLLCLDMADELTMQADDFANPSQLTPHGAAKIANWLFGKLAALV